MGGNARNFEHRVLRISDDGGDFEQFVFEVFRHGEGELGVTRRLARGRDGAIDLRDAASEPGSVMIAECKYIGSGRAAEAFTRWNEVFRNLHKNLPELALDPRVRPASPYRGWLDAARPVREYRFCVTVSMSEMEESDLAARIRADLRTLVDLGVEQLRSLVEDEKAIRVRSWDWFSMQLDDHPSLAFRWFRGLPIGVRLFGSDVAGKPTFRRFISGEGLRYFSRDQYAVESGRAFDKPESQLLRDLAEGEVPILLITGAGGVGKTRLCFELASALGGEAYGFDAYWLERNAGFKSVTDLAGYYAGNAKILLLVDYAEAAAGLSRIADAIAHLRNNSAHDIRLIVTCRSSATNRVRDSLYELESIWKSLDSRSAGEEDFARWVTNSILSLEAFPDVESLRRVCHGVPALAAFALYVFRHEPGLFDEQFGGLRSIDDFRRWIDRRISSLAGRLNPPGPVDRYLAEIAMELPCSTERWIGADPIRAAIMDALLADRWIEREDSCYVAAHDVFADALMLRWIFEVEHVATERLAGLLMLSGAAGELEHGLVVAARLASDSRFPIIDGEAVVATLLARHPDLVTGLATAILAGPMLTAEAKLRLLARSSEIASRILEDPDAQLVLGLMAVELAKGNAWEVSAELLTTFGGFLEKACDGPQGSNMLLRRAYAFDPVRFRGRAYESLTAFPVAETTHYLLVQMLRCGEPVPLMAEHVVVWLKHNGGSLKCSFLFPAWLKAGGNSAIIAGAVSVWLDFHGRSVEASHVYSAWLEANGDFDAISEPLLQWIQRHHSAPFATHGFAAWTRGGGELGAVADWLLEWLAGNSGSFEALYALHTWIDAGGLPDAVSAPVAVTLAEQGDRLEARNLYKSWLYQGHDREAIELALRSWLQVHGAEAEARQIYVMWLEAKEAVSGIREELVRWVALHGEDLEAGSVLGAWLSAEGDSSALRGAVCLWLDYHCLAPEARYVLGSWLVVTRDFQAFSASVDAWLAVHHAEEGARAVYVAWLDAGGPGEQIEEAIAHWLRIHGQEERAWQVYNAWLNSRATSQPFEKELTRWLAAWSVREEFSFISKSLVKAADLTEGGMIAVARWAALFPYHEDSLYRLSSTFLRAAAGLVGPSTATTLIRYATDVVSVRSQLTQICAGQLWSITGSMSKPSFFNKNPFGVLRLFAQIVATGEVFIAENAQRPFQQLSYTYDRICQLLRAALRDGCLNLARDRLVIERFVEWFVLSYEDIDETERMLAALRVEFPNDVWNPTSVRAASC